MGVKRDFPTNEPLKLMCLVRANFDTMGNADVQARTAVVAAPSVIEGPNLRRSLSYAALLAAS